MQWYLAAFAKYVTFEGRARRREYWTFHLVSILVVVVLAIGDGVIGTWSSDGDIGLLSGLYLLGVLLPTFSVGVRRLHDIGRSGWWLLVNLVPLVGPLVILVFGVQDGTPGDNAYGPNPKEFVA